MSLRVLGLSALLAILSPVASSAAGAPPDSIRLPAPAVFVFQGDTIVTLRATIARVPPARRAETAAGRLEALSLRQLQEPLRVDPEDYGDVVLIGDQFVLFLSTGDVDSTSGATVTALAETAKQRLELAIATRIRLMKPAARWRGALQAVAATLVLLILLWLLTRARRSAVRWIESQAQSHSKQLHLGEMSFVSSLSLAASWLSQILTQLSILFLVVIWVIFVLNRFVETQRWGIGARTALLRILANFRDSVLGALPGLLAVAIIVIVARLAAKFASDIFRGMERGTIQVSGARAETAGATRRLVVAAIWLFAVVIAYPLLPGSSSDVFRGVSVFLGVILSLGSSGVASHMMSGLVIIYSRSLRRGDVVSIKDIEGVVTEVGALSVKIARGKLEFTIPNSVVVGTPVKNYSRMERESGGILSTTVKVGYGAPWRVVHEMLIGSALRTPGVQKTPEPFVLQPRLDTFAVEYQLIVRIEPGADRFATLTLLHQNILDAFNERQIQIMVPAFEMQPEKPVLVHKEDWSRAPGDSPPA
jgi:small-conductance mechanosensitive channel